MNARDLLVKKIRLIIEPGYSVGDRVYFRGRGVWSSGQECGVQSVVLCHLFCILYSSACPLENLVDVSLIGCSCEH